MPVLRSREVVPMVKSKSADKTPEKGDSEPSTPEKTLENLNKSNNSTPSSSCFGAAGGSKKLESGSGLKTASVTGNVRRRSLRLVGKSGLAPNGNGENVESLSQKRKKADSVDDGNHFSDGDNRVLHLGMKKVRVSEQLGIRISSLRNTVEQPDEEVKTSIDECSGRSGERVEGERKKKGKRKLGVEEDTSDLKCLGGMENEKENVTLRSGKSVSKRVTEDKSAGVMGVESSSKDKTTHNDEGMITPSNDNGHGVVIKSEMNVDKSGKSRRRLSRETKGKGKVLEKASSIGGDSMKLEVGLETGHMEESADVKQVDEALLEASSADTVLQTEQLVKNVDVKNEDKSPGGRESGVKIRSRLRLDRGKGKIADNDCSHNGSDALRQMAEHETGKVNESVMNTRSRVSRLDKGKGKVIDNDSDTSDALQKSFEHDVGHANETILSVENEVSMEQKLTTQTNMKERFRDLAKRNASRFAHFSNQEEENRVADVAVEDTSSSAGDKATEEWPGPFSTAMKIIRDRETNAKVQQLNPASGRNKVSPIKWVPKKDQDRGKHCAPSLQELCWPVLVKNADAITSFDCIPDALKHKLCQLLCDSRRMNSHLLELLVCGSPAEIRVRECSWLTEEVFTNIFEACDTSNLVVLQLDFCGSCLPDYVLSATLARSPNSLPALTTISVKGAYRLSDAGLRSLCSSAPSLRSINLSQCSLLTSDGISCLVGSLGSSLRELYIDHCSIDAMLILPDLLKLQYLEVLSLAGIETVNDDFISKLVTAKGHNLKELILKDCVKLTDSSVKCIAETCFGLCAIDLSNLCKLTDAAIGYLANSCRAIQTLKLSRSSFSDEAIAAYLETCGNSLRELSLNYVSKVAHNAAVSLAKCSKNMVSLDLSWCRNLSNEALGLIVDSCSSLEVLKLFGCTQITDKFVYGHSNHRVQIIGLKMRPMLQHLKEPDLLQGPLRY